MGGPTRKDYSGTPLAAKLGIREGSRVLVVGTPRGFDLGPLPAGVRMLSSARGRIDVALVFVTRATDLRRRSGPIASRLDAAGRLWIAWPTKASGVSTDLSFDAVQRLGLDAGLVDNKSASITGAFQGLQFVYRLRDRAGR